MGMLAEWFVQLATKGKATVQKDVDETKKGLENASKSAANFGQKAQMAFLAASAAAVGFARAGLQGTAQGDMLALAFQRMTREVAGVALPVIELLGKVINGVTNGLKKLSGDGQAAVLALAGAIAVAIGVATGGISFIISGIIAIVAAMDKMSNGALSSGIMSLFEKLGAVLLPIITSNLQVIMAVLQPIFSIVNAILAPFAKVGEMLGRIVNKLTPLFEIAAKLSPVVVILSAIAGLFEMMAPVIEVAIIKPLEMVASAIEVLLAKMRDFYEQLRKAPGGSFLPEWRESKTGRSQVSVKGGGFEDGAATFKRIQSGIGQNIGTPEKQLKTAEDQLKEQQQTNVLLKAVVKGGVSTVSPVAGQVLGLLGF